jgi:alpha-L-fucosidase
MFPKNLYTADLKSIQTHPLPAWYAEAKFGIFVHWGLFSVPAFAPTRQGDYLEMMRKYPQAYVFAHQPYAEWYLNSLRIPGSPTHQYHLEKYGERFPYEAFSRDFNQQAKQWDAQAWADCFRKAGAKYVVLVTKHHDGFLLWPSRTPNPRRSAYQAERDLVGDLTQAVRRNGMHMGHYYSSALDWTFTERPILSIADLLTSGPVSQEYLDYVVLHWHELIDRYQTDILWSDIGYPPGGNLYELFAYYYNRHPEGVVNDRWSQIPPVMRGKLGRALINAMVKVIFRQGRSASPRLPHCDFLTTEYTGYNAIQAKKWEACRGIGNSFGYNQFESEADYLSGQALVDMLVEIVSRNGNLLLNVGPRPDGSIPEPQLRALEGIGSWLAANGEAIYGSRPWQRSEDALEGGGKACYTAREGVVYAALLGLPAQTGQVCLPLAPGQPAGRVRLLASGQYLRVETKEQGLVVHLPEASTPETPVLAIEAAG